MLASTILAIPFVPVFYVITQSLSERRKKHQAPAKLPADEAAAKPE
jgi:hypothetical protein